MKVGGHVSRVDSLKNEADDCADQEKTDALSFVGCSDCADRGAGGR